MNSSVFFIINPIAGSNNAAALWKSLENVLKSKNQQYDFQFTKCRHHATEIARRAAHDNYDKLIAVGGDGTFNEMINSLRNCSRAPESISFGNIAVGTGNDWIRSTANNVSPEDYLTLINDNKTKLMDLGDIQYRFNGNHHERYFVNIAGVGFDAEVAQKVNFDKNRNKAGVRIYVKNLLSSLIKSKPQPLEIIIDGKHYKRDVFSMCVGIGKFNGGGMMQLPSAVMDDGLFDINIINPIGKLKVLRNIKNLFDGSYIKNKEIELFRGKHVKINSSAEIKLEADGEYLGHNPITISILERRLKVFTSQ